MNDIKERSSCTISNCRTHEAVLGLPGFLNGSPKHYNCVPAHPCLECIKCPDCKAGRAYHSSIHGTWIKPAQKTKVYLTDDQKLNVKNLFKNGASIRDLASQFNAHRNQIAKILKTT